MDRLDGPSKSRVSQRNRRGVEWYGIRSEWKPLVCHGQTVAEHFPDPNCPRNSEQYSEKPEVLKLGCARRLGARTGGASMSRKKAKGELLCESSLSLDRKSTSVARSWAGGEKRSEERRVGKEGRRRERGEHRGQQ